VVALDPELFEFRAGDTERVLARMEALDRDRSGWINFSPGFDEVHEPPPTNPVLGLFSGRGPMVPICTWTPGERKRNREEPTTIGVQHATGPKVVARLADAGVPVPPAWRVLMDHPRRGLVVALPPDATHAEILAWLLAAGGVLSIVPLTGDWRAAVYRTS
jgi:hypothetical protein